MTRKKPPTDPLVGSLNAQLEAWAAMCLASGWTERRIQTELTRYLHRRLERQLEIEQQQKEPPANG